MLTFKIVFECFNKFLPPLTRGDSTLLHSTVLDFLFEHIVSICVCVCVPYPSPLSVTSCSFLSLLPTHSLPPQGSLLFGSCGFWSSGLSQLPYHPFSPVVPTPPPALEVSPSSAISPFYLAPTKPATAEPFHARRNAHFSSFFPSPSETINQHREPSKPTTSSLTTCLSPLCFHLHMPVHWSAYLLREHLFQKCKSQYLDCIWLYLCYCMLVTLGDKIKLCFFFSRYRV